MVDTEQRRDAIQALLQYRFNDPALIDLAMTHRSVSSRNNERLEFLGDAVLDTVVSGALLQRRPVADEGELSRLRASLVQDRSLAVMAADMKLGQWVGLGEGERRSGGWRRQSILADAIEALIGAVFIDGGYNASELLVMRWFGARLDNLPQDADLKDPKTRLQEWLQERGAPLPKYEVTATRGKPHQQVFDVTCSISEPVLTVAGTGGSRRKAEQSAALALLERLEGT